MSDNKAAWTPFAGLESLPAAWMAAMTPFAQGDPMRLASQLLDPRQWLGIGGAALEQPFETVLGLPRLADMPDLDRKLSNLLGAWMAVAQRGSDYAALVSQAWVAACDDFLRALSASAVEGRPARSGRELLDRWTAAVNERLLKTQRSTDFLEAQRRLLDAMLTSRAAERALVEVGAKAADLPTRAEIDDVHKTLHAVKRELRAMQRWLAASEAGGGRAAALPPSGRRREGEHRG